MYIAKKDIYDDPKIPEGVKRFFACYASEIDLFGEKVLFVSGRLHWNYEDYAAYYNKQKGVAPSHSVDLREFEKWMPTKQDTREGVPPNTFYPIGVGEWIHQHQSHGGKKIVTLYEIGERHRYDAFCD